MKTELEKCADHEFFFYLERVQTALEDGATADNEEGAIAFIEELNRITRQINDDVDKYERLGLWIQGSKLKALSHCVWTLEESVRKNLSRF